MRLALAAAALALAPAALALAVLPARADRDALWTIVHGQCVPAAEMGGDLPKPCLEVKGATAVIKDRNGVAQLLAIPVAQVKGIEDPALLKPDAPHYFADAYAARGLMRRFLPSAPAREGLVLSVNSPYSRSQDQLHIHVDCLSRESQATLAAYAAHLDGQWRPMTEALAGRKYWAMRVDTPDLAGVDPFRLLADGMPERGEMANWTLAAAPMLFDGRPGFALLADRAEMTAGGHAEDVADHACAIAG